MINQNKSQILNLSIILVVIVSYSCTMHREYHDFNGVHVYLGSNRISLVATLSVAGKKVPLKNFWPKNLADNI